MNLVVVESPAKSRTLKKFLGEDYDILASYGHIRDLIPKKGAVDPDNDFEMKYEALKNSGKQIGQIVTSLKKADNLYLATDPDREGEAISWHLCELLKEKKLLGKKNIYRIVFHEITESAILKAFENPRNLSNDLINAQQARRALDHLVGFNLSPLLWRKIKSGLSAGRVQSPALRMIVERELEIEAFKPREYWTIDALLNKEESRFPARLYAINGKKVNQFDIADEKHAFQIRDAIRTVAADGVSVAKIEKKQRKRHPQPPFTTSTLQQDAVRKLGFSASKAMRIAQQLYEGIDLGSGPVGLITYMRTDSVTLANDAIKEIRNYIGREYGKERVPDKPRLYKTKSKNAQEAHEAIRPTSMMHTPRSTKNYLQADQYRLYELIWKRTVACQMIHATLDTVSVDFQCGDYTLRATGSTVIEPGFMLAYTEAHEERESSSCRIKKEGNSDEQKLPPLSEKERVALEKINAEQHFTEPPPRYSEASLVKALEGHGIGRPSTYASIIATLQNRGYAELLKKRFHPTDTGRTVNCFLTKYFNRYVDYEFTADLEDELDNISRGERDWIPVMREFWKPFKQMVDSTEKNVTRADASPIRELGTDPKSGRTVSVRLGRYGPYAQIGTREDDEKPQFSSLRPHQKISQIILEEALELFNLPREIGETHEGEPVQANIGKYGPYLRYGNKFASLKEDDPYTITLERALEVIAAKKQADAKKVIRDFPGCNVRILKGRWGPFITDGSNNVRIGKDTDAATLSLEECQSLLEAAPLKKKRAVPAKKKFGNAKD